MTACRYLGRPATRSAATHLRQRQPPRYRHRCRTESSRRTTPNDADDGAEPISRTSRSCLGASTTALDDATSRAAQQHGVDHLRPRLLLELRRARRVRRTFSRARLPRLARRSRPTAPATRRSTSTLSVARREPAADHRHRDGPQRQHVRVLAAASSLSIARGPARRRAARRSRSPARTSRPGATVTVGGAAGDERHVVDDPDMTADDARAARRRAQRRRRSRTPTAPPARSPTAGSPTSSTCPARQQFYQFVTTLVSNAITAGFGGGIYGVDAADPRQQMAVFLLKAKHGLCYVPPPCTGVFADVPARSALRALDRGARGRGHHGRLRRRQLLPDQPRPRQQMAVFLLRPSTARPTCRPPAPATSRDVPARRHFANWIERARRREHHRRLRRRQLLPGRPNTRGQMAVFLVEDVQPAIGRLGTPCGE